MHSTLRATAVRDQPAARAPTLAEAQRAGFPVGGEPLALDLADTLVTVTDPPTELLTDESRSRAFWALQAGRLPVGATPPSLAATRALRAATRDLLEARASGRQLPSEAVAVVNLAAAAAPFSPCLKLGANGWSVEPACGAPDDGAWALASVARSAIDLIIGDTATRLRRCANPECSMLFVAESGRRVWCTPNICGNRARVARHYRRHRAALYA